MSNTPSWGQTVLDEFEIKERAKQLATKMRMTPGLLQEFWVSPWQAIKHDNVQHLTYDLPAYIVEKVINKTYALLSQQDYTQIANGT